MNLAIFLDAAAVAGDADAAGARRGADVDDALAGNDIFYARFAAAVNQFGAAWWTRLPGLSGRAAAEIDLKKLGIFPIVHGVRTLALQYRTPAIGTDARLEALVAAGRIDAPLGARPARRAALLHRPEAREQPAADWPRGGRRTTRSGSPISARWSAER